jgi:hypothetical protein
MPLNHPWWNEWNVQRKMAHQPTQEWFAILFPAHFRTHDANTQAVIQAMRAVDKRIVM